MKAPIEGVVTYVSSLGTEVHLKDDPKRYRGAKVYSPAIGNHTMRVFQGVVPGDVVRLHWGGFANLSIIRCEILKLRSGYLPTRPLFTGQQSTIAWRNDANALR